MKENDYLLQLETALKKRGVPNVSEIMQDYREHFTFARESGKSDDQICEKLGSPEAIAKAYETEGLIKEIKSPEHKFDFLKSLKVIGRLLLLAPFNFLVLLIPGVIAFSLLAAGWAVAISIFACGVVLFSVGISAKLALISFWAFIAATSSGLGVIGLGLLAGAAIFFMTKHFILACISYLQWNVRFVLEK